MKKNRDAFDSFEVEPVSLEKLNPVPITRNMDEFGRIVLPKEWRDEYGMKEHQPVGIQAVEGGFYVQILSQGCHFCGYEPDGEQRFYRVKLQGKKEIVVCDDCVEKIQKCRENANTGEKKQ